MCPDDDIWVKHEEECVLTLPPATVSRRQTPKNTTTKMEDRGNSEYQPKGQGGELAQDILDSLSARGNSKFSSAIHKNKVWDLPQSTEYVIHVKSICNLPSSIKSGQRIVVRLEVYYGEDLISRALNDTTSVFVDQGAALYVILIWQ